MVLEMNQNYFALFGLLPGYFIDTEVLDQSYRDIQRHVHPDRHAHAADAERRVSMQLSTYANEAYRTLKKPITRAQYLLQMRGINALEESNTSMPGQFLMQQMEWREAIDDAARLRNEPALKKLERELKAEIEKMLSLLGTQLESQADTKLAAENVRKLKFMEKLIEEIQETYEVLEVL